MRRRATIPRGSIITLNWIPDTEWIVWASNVVEFFVFNPANGQFLCVRMQPKVYKITDKPRVDLEKSFQELTKGVPDGIFTDAMHGTGKLQEVTRRKFNERGSVDDDPYK